MTLSRGFDSRGSSGLTDQAISDIAVLLYPLTATTTTTTVITANTMISTACTWSWTSATSETFGPS